MLYLLRQWPEPIDKLGAECLDLALVLDFRKTSIERKPHRQIGDIALGNHHRCSDRDLRRPLVGDRSADTGFETRDRLFQHLLIKLEADLLNVPGLLLAQQVAGAPNVEIVRSKLKSGAQRIER